MFNTFQKSRKLQFSTLAFMLAIATLMMLTSKGSDAVAQPPLIQGSNIGANNSSGQSVVVDTSGNRYVIGFFAGTDVDFNLASGAQDLKSSVSNSYDVFVTKFNASGAYVWTQVFGGTGDDRGFGVAVTPDGSKVYATGQLGSSDAGFAGTAGTISNANGGTFILALNASDGSPVTGFGTNGVQQFGSNNNSSGVATVASNSIVYVAGNFSNASKIGNTGSAISSAGGQDVFVIALNSATGAAVTSFGLSSSGIQSIGGTNNENVYGLSLTANASTLYIAGSFASSGNGSGLGVGGAGNISSAGGNNAFVAALNASDGSAKTSFNSTGIATFGGQGDVQAFAVTATNSNVYFTGYFSSANGAQLNGVGTSFNSNNQDVMIVGLTDTGSAIQNFGNGGVVTVNGFDGNDVGTGITTVGGNIFICGYHSSRDLRLNAAGPRLSTQGSNDAFILALSGTTGAPVSVFGSNGYQKFGGTGDDRAYAIAAGASYVVVNGFTTSGDGAIGLGRSGNINWAGYQSFLLQLNATSGNPPFPVITSPKNYVAEGGQPFSYQITATGSPTSYDISPNPPFGGLTFNSATGLLSGTTNGNTGNGNITLTATNAFGSSTQTVCMFVYNDSIANQAPPTVYAPNVNNQPGRHFDVDSSGNRYVTAWFSSAYDFNPKVGTAMKYSTVYYSDDVYVCKYTPSGDLAWVRTWGGSNNEHANAVTVSPDGTKVYVTGYTQSQDNGFDGLGGNFSTLGTSCFVLALNGSDGTPVTAFGQGGVQLIGAGNEQGYGIVTNSTGSQVYVTGFMSNNNNGIGGFGTLNTTGGQDAFVAALNASDGTGVSGFGTGGIQRIGGTNNDVGHAIAITPDDATLYVAGYFRSTDFGIGGTGSLAAVAENNTFIAALNSSDGSAKTSFTQTGVAKLGSTSDVIPNQVVASNTNVYVTGYFYNAIQYNGAGTTVPPALSANGRDIYVLALTSGGATVSGFGVSGSGIGTFGGSEDKNSTDITYATGALFVSGFMASPHAHFNNSTVGAGVSTRGSYDAFVYKIDAITGAPVSTFGSALGFNGLVRFGGGGNDQGMGVAVRGSNVYFSGYYSSSDASIALTYGYFNEHDSNGSDLFGFLFTLDSTTGSPNLPVITSADIAAGVTGQNFTYQIVATGNPTSYSATGLFDNLTLDSSTGLISGTNTNAGANGNVMITATNAIGSTSKTIAIYIVDDEKSVTAPTIIKGGDSMRQMTVDASGNRYICGYFSNPTDFNPYKPGADIKVPAFPGRTNAYVTRFNSDGSYAWTQTFGGSSNDNAVGVAVSPDGNTVYAVGYFSSFDAGFGGHAGSLSRTNSNDAFVIALAANTGTPISNFGFGGVQVVGGSGDDVGHSIVVSPDNSKVYISFYSSSSDVGIGARGSFASTGSYDVMVAALDASTGAAASGFGSGGLQKMGGSGFDLVDITQGGGMSLTPDGNTLYICGYFQSSDFGIGGTGSVTNSGSEDAFIVALNTSDGSAKTAFNGNGIVTFGGNNSDVAHGIIATNSNVYTTGSFRSSNVNLNGVPTGISSIYASGNGSDTFVLALKADGSPVNTFGISNSGIATIAANSEDYGTAIAVSGGNLFVAGFGNGNNFQFNQTGPSYGTLGSNDAFVAKFNATTGQPVPAFGSAFSTNGWVRFGGSNEEQARSIVLSGSTVYVAGFMNSSDAGIGTYGSFSSNGTPGNFNAFVAALDSTTGTGTGLTTPTITSPVKAVGLTNQSFSYQITATGSPVSFNAMNLPDGLTVNTSTGVISGTATSATDDYNVIISATNAQGMTGSKRIGIYIVNDGISNTYPPVAVAALNGFSKCLAVDASGNRYVAGYFNGSRDMNPIAGVDAKAADSVNGNNNAFVIKFNSTGTYAWSQTFACDSEAVARAVAVSPDGTKVFVTGYAVGHQLGVGTSGQSGTLNNSYDAFVMALHANDGSALSSFGNGGYQLIGGGNNDFGNAIVVSPDNSKVYVGLFGNSNDIGIGTMTYNFPAQGSNDGFVAALDASTGAEVTAFGIAGMQRIAGNGDDQVNDIALSPDGSTLYAGGLFSSNNFGIGNTGNLSTLGDYDAFVAALNTSNGSPKTTFNSTGLISFGGSSGFENINGLAATNSNVYATGCFRSQATKLNGTGLGFDASNNSLDAFVLALNADGTPVNTFGVSGSGIAVFSGVNDEEGRSIAISGGNLYVTGYFGSFNTQYNYTGARLPTIGSNDAFVIKISATTSALDATFASAYGTPGLLRLGGGGDDRGYGIAVAGNTIYTAGSITSGDFGISARGNFSYGGGSQNYFGYLLTLDTTSGQSDFPVITSPTNLKGMLGVAFSYPIVSTGSAITYALIADPLPNGLTLNTSTGVISGTPTVPGTFGNIIVTATNAVGSAQKTFTIYITAADWVAQSFPPVIQGSIPNQSGHCIAMDSAGNHYVCGAFGNVQDFNPKAGGDFKITAGSNDVFVTKFGPAGEYLWTQTFGGSSIEQATAIAVTPDGSKVYTVGYLYSTDAGFGGNLGNNSTAGNYDGFVICLNGADGSPVTSFGARGYQGINGNGNELAYDCVLSPDNSKLYVCGEFNSGQIGIGTFNNLSTSGGVDGFIAAINAGDGSAITAFGTQGIQKLGGDNNDYAYALAVTPDGNTLYATGILQSYNFGIGGNGPANSNNGNQNAFVVALNTADGSAKTAFNSTGIASFGGSNNDVGTAIVATNNAVYVAGYFASSDATVNGTGTAFTSVNSSNDTFILALNADGSPVNTFGITGSGVSTFGNTGNDFATGLTLSGANLYAFVTSDSTGLMFNGTTLTPTVSTSGNQDAFVLKLNATSGALVTSFNTTGVQKFGGSDNNDQSNALTVFGNTVWGVGAFYSSNAGFGGTGPYAASGTNGIGFFNGYLSSLNMNTGAFQYPPSITSLAAATLVAGTTGPAFTITTSGAPTVTSIARTGSALPGGVTYTDHADGTATLTGMPAAGTGGIYNYVLTATNGTIPDYVQNFTLTVNEPASFTNANNTVIALNTRGTFTFTTRGFPAPTILKSGSLPPGVTFTDNGNGTATLSGTPTVSGDFTLNLTAQNGIGADGTQTFTLHVYQPAAITSANTATFAVMFTNSATITTTGFPAPTLSASGALPNGVTFIDNGNGTAKLTGTPALGTAGSYPLVITAHSAATPDAQQNFTLLVTSPDYTVQTSGNAIVVTNISNNGDTVTLTEPSAGNIQFAAATRTFCVDGNTTFITGNSGSLSLTGVTTVTLNCGSGNDVVNVGAFTANLPSLSLKGGSGNDTVNLNGSMTFASGGVLYVAAEAVNIGVTTSLTTSGAGTISVVADDVAIDSTSSLISANFVTLTPQTPARPIALGSEVGGQLSLTSAEIARIAAPTLRIGDANSGTITLKATVATTANLALASGVSILSTGGSLATTGATISFDTPGTIGTVANRIAFADNTNTAQQNVVIGSLVQPSGVFLDGLGSVTLCGISGGTSNAAVDVTARANLVVSGVITSGTSAITMAADVTATSSADNGTGTLTIASNATVNGASITLRGADIDIVATAQVGLATTNQVTILSSQSNRPMNIGGSNNAAVAGINLISAELARITSSSSATITFGNSNQAGDITFVNATPATALGAATTILQSPSSAGKIVLNTGGNALNGNGGLVTLISGTGNIEVGQLSTDVSLTTNGFNAAGLTLNLTLGSAPTLGSHYKIVNNTSVNPITGTFTGIAQNSLFTANYNSTPYTFQANYNGGDGNDFVLTFLGATSTTAGNASAPYKLSAQNVTLNANVTSSSGTVNEGAVTFQIMDGATPIGTPLTSGTVSNGIATVSYSLPAGTPAKTYTVIASFAATANFNSSSDNTHTLTVNPASTTTAATPTIIAFSQVAQNVNLNATVTSAAGVLNEGTVTFLLKSGNTTIGSSVSSSTVANGAASADYSVPAGTAVGSYTIQVTYNGTTSFLVSSDSTQNLTISKATTTTTASAANSTYSISAQNVTLNANITSPAGTVNEGTVTFHIMDGATIPIGTPVTSGTVTNGNASVAYSLPAGTPVNTYTIVASFANTATYTSSSDNMHTLTVNPATTTTAAAPAITAFSQSAQNVTLNATVTSAAGAVNEGTVTFQLLNGAATIGTAVTSSPVANGVANVTYSVPAGTAVGSYTIQASYSSAMSFIISSNNTQNLTISKATTTTIASAANATFNLSAQNVTLIANVTSPAGTVNEGTLTFQIMDGAIPIGIPETSGTVTNGNASVSYSLPAGTPAKTYTVIASFASTAKYNSSSDNTHTLTVNPASTTTAATPAIIAFSQTAQNVNLSVSVTSAAGVINEGTVTVVLKSGNTTIGSAVTSATVANGAASVDYSVPASTAVGQYTIQASYSNATNYLVSSDSTQKLTISHASTITTASAANATYSLSAQNVSMSAMVVSPAGTVNEGTVTFQIMDGATPIGAPVSSGTVTNGIASASYSLPAGTPVNTYTIVASFVSTATYNSSSDSTHTLTLNPAITTIAADPGFTVFSQSAQNVTLNATVISAAGAVNEGTVTFQLLNAATNLGTAVESSIVANGTANVTYSVPAGTAVGSYTIQASYSSAMSFLSSSDSKNNLIISNAVTTTTASATNTTYSLSAQNLTLSANVNSPAGTVNEGAVSFQIMDGVTPIGSPILSGTVTTGTASVSYSLPAGTPVNTYTIIASFASTARYNSSSDNSQTMTLNPAATTTIADPTITAFSQSAQDVALNASVTSAAGVVNEGTVTFQLLDGTTNLGILVTSAPITTGTASATYTLPAGTLPGNYTIIATYASTLNFTSSSDSTNNLTIYDAASTTAVTNATANFASLQQVVTLNATVTSPAGVVNEGTVSFQVFNLGAPVDAAVVSSIVTNGSVAIPYALPAGTELGTYSIEATYDGGANFQPSIDTTHTLTIGTANTTTAVTTANVPISPTNQNVTLSATVTSVGGPVNEGTITFQVYQSTNAFGAPLTSTTIINGVGSVTFTVPGGTGLGAYGITANYSGSGHYDISTDSSRYLNVNLTHPIITSPLAAAGVVGLPFTYTLTATNLPTGFSASNLPPGLSFDPITAQISGIPTTIGNTNATISSTNISGADTQTLVVTITPNQAPIVPALNSDDNPALLNQTVTYSIKATDADTPILSYIFNFGDGSPDMTGVFPQGTVVTLSHVYSSYTDGVPVTLTVNDGFTAVTQTTLQKVPAPNSTGAGVTNTLVDAPPVVSPLDGLGVKVMASDGGVIQLGIDVSSLTRSAYAISTDWGDIAGRSSKTTGTHPVHQFDSRGIFVAKTTAVNSSTNAVAGHMRLTLPISSKETGDYPANSHHATPGIRTAASNDSTITTRAINGKFAFKANTNDVVTYTGDIKLPAGITIGQEHEFWMGIGNIVVTTTLDKNCKGIIANKSGTLKNVKMMTKLKKGTVTLGGEPATITVTYSAQNMVANGFDSEGVSNQAADAKGGKVAQRQIQIAMLLDGAPFQSLAPANFSVSHNSDFGTINGRSSK